MTVAAPLLAVLLGLTASQDPDPAAAELAPRIDELVARLKDPDPQAREAAALVLGLLGREALAAVPALLEALDDACLFGKRA